ncbi:MAG: response regulator, partial [Clostridia bacterium]|nr:response regulator [Clostridia bacterium]
MKRVMIVDDEFLVRIGVRSMLDWEAHGYEIVAEATSGQDAIAKIPCARPQIILTDLVMEPMDGLELLEFCAQQYPDIRIVVLSNYNDFEKVKQAMKLGARDFFFKLTADPSELLRALDCISLEINRRGINAREAEQLISRNAGAIRKRLVRVMLEGAYASEDEVLRELELTNVECDLREPYRVMLLKIADASVAGDPGTPKGMLVSTLESMAREHFASGLRAQIFRLEDERLAVVVNTGHGNQSRDFEAMAARRFESLDGLAMRYMGLNVLGALSGQYQGVSQFRLAAAQAEASLANAYFMRANRLCLPGADDIPARPPTRDEEGQWRTLIAQTRFDEARALLDALFERLYGCRGAADGVREGLYRLYDAIKRDAAARGVAESELSGSTGITPYQAIFHADRLKTVEDSLGQALMKYRRRLEGMGGKRIKREVARTLDYVRDNLSGDLSVAAVSRQAHMSESYFSRLFKAEMEVGFVEYVNRARIDKAKELLAILVDQRGKTIT